MTPIKCIVIEDEPLAADILKEYIDQVPHLDLIGVFENALKAIEFLSNEKVDLLFLDIHLPKLKGLDFLKSLSNSPKVIITTAYHEYALKGYDFNIVDYLLKPIEFQRFLTAINKVRDSALTTNNSPIVSERPFHFFYSDRKRIKVYLDEIIYIESLKEYVKIVAPRQKIIIHSQIGQINKILTSNFIRIHRSFIVSIPKIDSYTMQSITINGEDLPIGRIYKESVTNHLKSFELN